MPFISINPATGQTLRRYRPHSPAQIERALKRARSGFLEWRQLSLAERAVHFRAAGRVLRKRADEFARLIAAEMGKPLGQGRGEVVKCASVCDFYAKEAAVFLADQHPAGGPRNTRVVFDPLGPILAIMPWNFPFWQTFRAAAPALMAGNTMLLKHSPNVCGCALAIAKVFAEADFPAGVFQTLIAPVSAVPAIIADDRVQGVTLTGSVGAGKHVAALAGAAMKPGVFELGGSDPYLVLDDADLDHAAEVCAQSRLINAGQSCVSAKRFIVAASVRRDFEKKFAARLAARIVGDPLHPATDVGPMARRDLRDHLEGQVRASVKGGARVLLGGNAVPGPGFYFEPTLLSGVPAGVPAHDEELFGPVAAVIVARDDEAAIATANASVYGLGAAVFSGNRRRARKVAARLEAGAVFINDFVRSDPTVPFGGIKLSGHGRELGSFGIHEFVNVKTMREF